VDALAFVTRITGTLTANATALARIEIPRLTEIGGALTITSNTVLEYLSMPSLNKVTGATTITGNPLGDLDADPLTPQGINLSAFTTATGGINVSSTALETLDLAHVTGTIDYLRVRDCPNLETLDLRYITTTTGRLNWGCIGGYSEAIGLCNLPSLSTLNLDSLTTIWTGGLTLSSTGVPRLQLPNLRGAIAFVGISGNGSLRSVSANGLESVNQTYPGFNVASNPSLEHLSLSGLTTVTGTITITGNPLGDLDQDPLTPQGINLSALTTSTGGINIRSSGLTTLNLSSLTGTLQYLLVRDCPELRTLNVGTITTTTGYLNWGCNGGSDSIALCNLPLLTSVNLDRLTTMASTIGGLVVSSTGLTNLQIPGLTGTAWLSIQNNSSLQDFSANSLASIQTSLSITNNPGLSSFVLDGLDTFPTGASTIIRIQTNAALDCATDICPFKAQLDAIPYPGTWTISPCTCP